MSPTSDKAPVYFVGYCEPDTCEVSGEAFSTRDKAQHHNLSNFGSNLSLMGWGWRYRSDTGELFTWNTFNEEMIWAVKGWLLKHGGHQIKRIDTIDRYSEFTSGGSFNRSHGFHYTTKGNKRVRVPDKDYYGTHIGDSATRAHIDALFEGWSGHQEYWMDAYGGLNKAEQGHLYFAAHYLNIKYDGYNEAAIYGGMFAQGFVRVVMGQALFVDTSGRGLTRAQFQNLKDMAIEKDVDLIETIYPEEGGRITKTLYQSSGEEVHGTPVRAGMRVESNYSISNDPRLYSWLLPDGTFQPVHGKGSHAAAAVHLLKDVPDNQITVHIRQSLAAAWERGWARITHYGGELMAETDGKPLTRKQVTALIDLAIETRQVTVQLTQDSSWRTRREIWWNPDKEEAEG